MAKTPRRASSGNRVAPILTEQQARDLAAAVRAKFVTVEEAQASAEWRNLHPQITRRILTGWGRRPANSGIYTEERAREIARLYLVRPELLPGKPPGTSTDP